MNNIIVQDVLEVFATTDTKAYFIGLTSANTVTQTVQNNVIRAGIGNGIISQIMSDKEIKFQVTTGVHSDDIMAMQSGTDFSEGTITINATETCTLASGKLTIEGTPKGTTATVFDKYGKSQSGTIATKSITITGGEEGDIYTVVYESDVTGEILDLRSDAYPVAHATQLKTVAYDLNTNKIVADIYYIFPKAQPDGGINAQYQAGQNMKDEITFTAQLATGSKSYGKYVVVPRTAA